MFYKQRFAGINICDFAFVNATLEEHTSIKNCCYVSGVYKSVEILSS